MRQIFVVLVLLISTYCMRKTLALLESAEQHIIDECLNRYGGFNYENAKRLERYKQWSDSYEEIPCFTKCYLTKAYDIYNESTGFIPRKTKAQFGEPLYNACREYFEQQEGNSCQLAYNALHCIVTFENDPLILIESMQNLTTKAKAAMKECLVQFDEEKWSRLREYGAFPVLEPLPCFTQCFIGKLQLYEERSHRWNIENMRNNLGVPAEDAQFSTCRARRGRNRCATIYKQFTCFILAK